MPKIVTVRPSVRTVTVFPSGTSISTELRPTSIRRVTRSLKETSRVARVTPLRFVHPSGMAITNVWVVVPEVPTRSRREICPTVRELTPLRTAASPEAMIVSGRIVWSTFLSRAPGASTKSTRRGSSLVV